MLKQSRKNSGGLPRGLEWAFAAGAAAFLGVLLWFGVEIGRAQMAKSWPSVEGRITHFDYVPAGSRTGSGGVREVPVYDYRVADIRYTGQRMGFAFPGLGAGIFGAEFEEQTRHLRRRGPVQVFYDPGDPSSAIIWNAGAGWLVRVFAAGALLGFVGFTYAFIDIRRGGFDGTAPETR